MGSQWSPGTTRDVEEFAEATRTARECRALVGQQLAEQVVSLDVQASASVAATRVRAVVNAEAKGDPMLLRAAVMEAAATFGAWAAELDRTTPEGLRAVAWTTSQR